MTVRWTLGCVKKNMQLFMQLFYSHREISPVLSAPMPHHQVLASPAISEDHAVYRSQQQTQYTLHSILSWSSGGGTASSDPNSEVYKKEHSPLRPERNSVG